MREKRYARGGGEAMPLYMRMREEEKDGFRRLGRARSTYDTVGVGARAASPRVGCMTLAAHHDATRCVSTAFATRADVTITVRVRPGAREQHARDHAVAG